MKLFTNLLAAAMVAVAMLVLLGAVWGGGSYQMVPTGPSIGLWRLHTRTGEVCLFFPPSGTGNELSVKGCGGKAP